MRSFFIAAIQFSSVLCDDLETWDEAWEGGSRGKAYMCVCIYMLTADICCCTAETNSILQSNCPPILKKEHTVKEAISLKNNNEANANIPIVKIKI